MDLRVRISVGVLALASGALAGCGLHGPASNQPVHVAVSKDFGAATVTSTNVTRAPGGVTPQQILEQHTPIKLAKAAGKRRWSLYVNGIAATGPGTATAKGTGTSSGTSTNPSATASAGDRLWWDYHDQSAASTVPAVVGSFPEPFSNGTGGRRFPTVLTCGAGVTAACNTVAGSLAAQGVKVADQALGTGSGSDSLAVVVGTFAQLRGVIASELLSAGPGTSGVYGQFVGAGHVLELDDPSGRTVRTLRGDAGLIAAIQQPGLNQPVWLVTGTDAAGVQAASKALTPAKLSGHFAVAVQGARVLALPVHPQG